ncbi:MAG TPA: ABC transporter substrate-binding protein [Gaiellaceae bacterium]|nr:ABC transporter substrate-binding protein [Gaiellaceae bacterium]
MRRVILALLLAGLLTAALASAASSARSGARAAPPGSSVTISNEQGTTWTCNFNPYNASVQFLSFGPVYEPLVFQDVLKSGAPTPWLASKYAWSNDNKTLMFTMRPGVKWSDGKPLTAADVVFTFQLIKKHPALDLNAVWSVLSSVTQKGSDQVVFNFKTAAVPYFFYVAGRTPIVPQHLWAQVKDPVTYKDPKPVGSGGFEMSSCSPQVIKYTKNGTYWQKGLPKIDTVYYPAYTSNDPANLDLATGKAQWGSQFIPSIKSFYLSKSPDNHYWFPPVVNVSIFMNLKDPILSNLAVRKAMAYAIDRARVSQIGEYGYQPPANQTAIVTPTFQSWLKPGLDKVYGYDPQKAISILKAAGFTQKGGVFQTPAGKPLSFTMVNIGGYSDWVASAQIVAQELKAVGIEITPENLSSTTYDSDVYNGHYQLAYDGNEPYGPSPYVELRAELYSHASAPIGKIAASNWERYSNKTVDTLIDQYAATTSLAAQKAIVWKLEQAMVNDVPIIPITEGVDWYQYNTKSLTGWVTPQDPYAEPAAYVYPDWGVVALHLAPKG